MSNKFEELKKAGSEHYKTGGIEPIDLYDAGGMLRDFCLCSIIKYAYRNRIASGRQFSKQDMAKIRHYTEILEAAHADM